MLPFLTVSDFFFDKKLNIQTNKRYYVQDNSSLFKDGVFYQPSPYYLLKKIVEFLKPQPEDIFIDLGCGSGRVVFFMALQNLKKVVGVELNKKLIDIARRNLDNFKLGNSSINFINTDAASYEIKDENIFFLFNPFGYKTLEKVLHNIKNSLVANPRQIHIVYCFPIHHILIDDQDWLVLEKEIGNGMCLIWHNKFCVSCKTASLSL